jgi:hypothetical protein
MLEALVRVADVRESLVKRRSPDQALAEAHREASNANPVT